VTEELSKLPVFISWSGKRSEAVARALVPFLQDIVPNTDPWMSQEHLEAGVRWSSKISQRLDQSNVAIICLTPENQLSPWILFEAGAVAKAMRDDTRVIPLLIGMSFGEVKNNLATLFQGKSATREGIFDVVKSINAVRNLQQVDMPTLERRFKRNWPELEATLKKLPAIEGTSPKRDPKDIAEETLLLVRGLAWKMEHRFVTTLPAIMGVPPARRRGRLVKRQNKKVRKDLEKILFPKGVPASWEMYIDWLYEKDMIEMIEMAQGKGGRHAGRVDNDALLDFMLERGDHNRNHFDSK
jgi:hypothetical protein